MSLVTDRPFHNGEEPSIAPPDLQRAVTPLVHGVREIMASLYPLQNAFADAAARDKQAVRSFRKGRDIFRADWERYGLFLQQCRTYAGDYISLCEYVTTQPSTCLVFSKNVLDMGTKIYEEVSRILVTHRQIYRELLTSGTESSPESSRAMLLDKYSSANTDAHKSITTGLLVQINKINTASVRPDGADVFSTIQTALREIETSLADMKVFWNYQVDELASIISKPDAIFMINLSESVKRWKRYDAAITASIISISESSDAMAVNDILLSPSPLSSPTEHTISTIEYQVEPEAKCEAAAGQQREVANKETDEGTATEKSTFIAQKESAPRRSGAAKAIPEKKARNAAKECTSKDATVAMEAAVAALVTAKEKAAVAAAAATERKADMEAAVVAVATAQTKAAAAAIAEIKAEIEADAAAAKEKAAAEKIDMEAAVAVVAAAKAAAVAATVAAGKKAETEATAAAVAAAKEKVGEAEVAEKKAKIEAVEAAAVAVMKATDMEAAVAAIMAAKEKAEEAETSAAAEENINTEVGAAAGVAEDAWWARVSY